MSEEGASTKEQLLEAARRNNTDLMQQVLFEVLNSDEEKIANAINSARDSLGNSPLHLAAQNGSYEALDLILDQGGVEVDPINLLQGETPLHSVVRYSKDEPEHGTYLAEMLIEAGCDPRIKNKHGQKPIDLADPSNTELLDQLQAAEYAHMFGGENQATEDANDKEAEEGESGSESESESSPSSARNSN